MRKFLLGSVCVLVMGISSAAFANEWNGSLDANWADNANYGQGELGIGGNLQDLFSDNWGAEALFSYHGFFQGFGYVNAGGGVFYRDPDLGNIGAVIQFHDADSFPNTTQYGIGGNWFADPMVTVSARAGVLGLDSGQSAVVYYGGGQVAYSLSDFIPDLVATGSVDFQNGPHGIDLVDGTIKLEWLMSEDVPISLYVGYKYNNGYGIGFGGNGNTVMVGLKVYDNGGSATTLFDRQNSGSFGYAVGSPIPEDGL